MRQLACKTIVREGGKLTFYTAL
uniref:Uncharacterized protein n=1 Tax=Zea mays TaxID=4577 RepID=C4IZS9_MAIZE|nr:unknown [Zea mays]